MINIYKSACLVYNYNFCIEDGTPTTQGAEETKGESDNPFDVGENYEYKYASLASSFRFLLQRIYDNMIKNNPLLTKKVKISISQPIVGPLGSRKTVWGNFEETIRSIERKLDHAKDYVAAELGTEVNLNEKNQLVMKGRFQPKQIQNILKNYLKDYVKCNNCRSYKTELEKDASTRLHILKCKACGASNSVSNVTKGFHNMARGERRRM